MNTAILRQELLEGKHDALLQDIYVDATLIESQKKRYIEAIDTYVSLYGEGDVQIYSAPGRSEVGGNHTDHQHGEVLATAINLDVIGVVSKRQDTIKIVSDAFDLHEIALTDLAFKKEEEGTSEALVRGVLYRLQELGYAIGGFQAFLTSEVLMGSGMSSSAAFEVMIGTIVSGLYNDMNIDPVVIAKASQYAENVYFNKPCGLMDQCACAVGSLIHIDFKDTENPLVKKVDVDFSKFQHSLCIVDTLGSHADLTHEYAAIPKELKTVANYFGKEFLREVEEPEFYSKLQEVRAVCHDRAVLRAIHVFEENKRVEQEVAALFAGDFANFKEAFVASGDSSYKFLQNVYANSDVENQSVSIALALSQLILQGHGVCRVHGGGFAGTIQAFVEEKYVANYKMQIEKVFGKGTCHVLKVRKYGGIKVM